MVKTIKYILGVIAIASCVTAKRPANCLDKETALNYAIERRNSSLSLVKKEPMDKKDIIITETDSSFIISHNPFHKPGSLIELSKKDCRTIRAIREAD